MWPNPKAYGILVPQPGIKLSLPALEGKVLTTGLPGKSSVLLIKVQNYVCNMLRACVLSHFSCFQLCNPMDCSSPASSVHGILQARILEWVTMLSSRDLPDPGIKPVSLAPAALAGRFFTTNSTWEAHVICYHLYILKRKYI